MNIMDRIRTAASLRVYSRRPQARQAGFTLIEVMVVIAIMGILFSIAIPAFSSWRERSALRSASETMIAHLKQARHYAMAESRNVDVTLDTVSPDGYTLDNGGSHAMTVTFSDEYSNTISFGSSTSNIAGIRFKSDGQIAETDGSSLMGASIYLVSSTVSNVWKITVNRVGRAYMTTQ